MKKLYMSMILTAVLLALTVGVVYAGAIRHASAISVSGGNIVGTGYTQYVGSNPQAVTTQCSLMVVGYSQPAVTGAAKTLLNSQAVVNAKVTALTQYHHGEKMYTQCYHFVNFGGGVISQEYTTSNQITIP